MAAPAQDRVPPPPPWLGWSILGVGAVVVVVGLLLLVLRLTDDGDGDPSRLATTGTTTSTTVEITTTTVAPATTAAPTTTAAPSTTAAPRRTTTTRPATPTTAAPTTAAPTTAAPGPVFTHRDMNWYGSSDGTFAGDVKVTNNSSSPRNGTFTVRLLRFGEVVGVLRGSRTIPAGATAEVSLSSNDQYVSGVDDYEFSAS